MATGHRALLLHHHGTLVARAAVAPVAVMVACADSSALGTGDRDRATEQSQGGRAEGLVPTPGWAHGAAAEVPHGCGAMAPIQGACAEEGSLRESRFLRKALTALWGVATGCNTTPPTA